MHLTVGVGPARSAEPDVLRGGLRLVRAALLYGDAVSRCSPTASLLLHLRSTRRAASPNPGASRRGTAVWPLTSCSGFRSSTARPSPRVLDVRADLGAPLARFRSAVAEFTTEIGATPWSDDFDVGAERVYRQRVAPAVVLGTPDAVAQAVTAGLAELSLAANAAQGGWAYADARRAVRADRLFFVYAAGRRLRGARRGL